MSKRKADAFLVPPPAAPANRCAEFNSEVRALNAQFSSWVSRQQTGNADKLWDAGIKDYLKYAEKLRSDYQDVLTPSGSSDPTVPSGKVFVMGQGDMGQLGLGDDVVELGRPTLVNMGGGMRIIQVACGGMHTLALAEGGVVFSWGVNDEGALGREARGGHLAEQQGDTEGSEVYPEKVKMSGHTIVAISAGDSHSVALSTQGTVLAWGVFRDSSGKFGFSAQSKEVQPTPAPIHIPEKITAISSGSDHVGALSASGSVYTWGCAECGRLGRMPESECDPKTVKGDKKTWQGRLLTPAKVTGLGPMQSVACGLYCTFTIGSGGEVWAWGLNQYGQLAIEADGPFYSPQRVPVLAGKGVTKIGGGEHHTVVVTRGGEALSFGRATYGRLGRKGVDVNADERNWQPGKMEVGGKVVDVAGGLSVSGIVMEDGGLYCCGSGGEGLLGQGDDESDAVLPKKVPVKGGALGVSFGGTKPSMILRQAPYHPTLWLGDVRYVDVRY